MEWSGGKKSIEEIVMTVSEFLQVIVMKFYSAYVKVIRYYKTAEI